MRRPRCTPDASDYDKADCRNLTCVSKQSRNATHQSRNDPPHTLMRWPPNIISNYCVQSVWLLQSVTRSMAMLHLPCPSPSPTARIRFRVVCPLRRPPPRANLNARNVQSWKIVSAQQVVVVGAGLVVVGLVSYLIRCFFHMARTRVSFKCMHRGGQNHVRTSRSIFSPRRNYYSAPQ